MAAEPLHFESKFPNPEGWDSILDIEHIEYTDGTEIVRVVLDGDPEEKAFALTRGQFDAILAWGAKLPATKA